MTNTNLSESEGRKIQRSLRSAMNALDACGLDDLSSSVHVIFKTVASRVYGTPPPTPDVTPAPWYDNHANLYTLAEWLRENRGWNFCKDNLLDVLETPWSWEKEWRLAGGEVHFVELHADEQSTVDRATCDWCDAPVGYVSWVHEGTETIEWFTTYEDTVTGEIACDDCAGTAANFAETTNLAATQVLS